MFQTLLEILSGKSLFLLHNSLESSHMEGTNKQTNKSYEPQSLMNSKSLMFSRKERQAENSDRLLSVISWKN